jgi:hypothetical protein
MGLGREDRRNFLMRATAAAMLQTQENRAAER